MMPKEFIVTNFAYGTGPYLRTTELALAFNDELEKRGKERLGIIVPLVYGEKQKKIMAEEFAKDEIILDEKLGKILRSVFYPVKSRVSNGVYGDYAAALANWVLNCKEVSQEAHKYLRKTYGDSIVVELNRSPRIRYDVAPVYFTTFGYIAEILENVRKLQEVQPPIEVEHPNIDVALLEKGIEIANWVESSAKIHAVAYPATFSWQKDYKPRYATEILTPPIRRPYSANSANINPGIFVTVTGIPGLERLYGEARRVGLNLYSNDIKAVATSTWVLPHIIPNQNIVFQFARSGWGSVWLSMISGTPLVVPDFDPKDDPEIYFNNLAVEKLGIGIIYRDQPLEEILKKRKSIQVSYSRLRDEILARWGTLDGNTYCAKLFAEDFLKL